jgi:hypothetical protein
VPFVDDDSLERAERFGMAGTRNEQAQAFGGRDHRLQRFTVLPRAIGARCVSGTQADAPGEAELAERLRKRLERIRGESPHRREPYDLEPTRRLSGIDRVHDGAQPRRERFPGARGCVNQSAFTGTIARPCLALKCERTDPAALKPGLHARLRVTRNGRERSRLDCRRLGRVGFRGAFTHAAALQLRPETALRLTDEPPVLAAHALAFSSPRMVSRLSASAACLSGRSLAIRGKRTATPDL